MNIDFPLGCPEEYVRAGNTNHTERDDRDVKGLGERGEGLYAKGEIRQKAVT